MLPFLLKVKRPGSLSEVMGKTAEVKDEEHGPDQDYDKDMEDAAHAVLHAIEQKSVIDLAKALKAVHMVCSDDEDESEEAPE